MNKVIAAQVATWVCNLREVSGAVSSGLDFRLRGNDSIDREARSDYLCKPQFNL